MRKNNKGDIVFNIPTRLRYYLDPLAILVGGIIIVLALNYTFKLIS